MRLSNKIIDSVIEEVAGGDVVPLVRELKNKKNVSEFVLADTLDREINETRNMLYRLYQSNLVSFTRKKDKSKGWYIYYWTFDSKRLRYLTLDLKRKRLHHLKMRLLREENNNFYSCQNECLRLDLEKAMEFQFKCPECCTVMLEQDNSKRVAEITQNIKQLSEELKK